MSFDVLWLQSGGCGGCTMSLLCAEDPGLFETFEDFGIRFLWHPSISRESGAEVVDLLEDLRAGRRRLDALCLEGSVMCGPNGTGRFHMLAGTGKPMMWWLRELAERADHVLAIGSCAAWGGMTSAGSNPGGATGLQYDGVMPGGLLGEDFRAGSGLPVINVAGCPTHPDWVIETLVMLATGAFGREDLDPLARPRFFADHLVHHGCTKNEFYEYKASAERLGQEGCMMEHLGCIGTQAHADCNIRPWNGEGSCTRGNYPCINCTAPEFEEPGRRFTETPKLAGIPLGLPSDMPRAWFVALASLAKAATPERLRENAVADRIVHPPRVVDVNRRPRGR